MTDTAEPLLCRGMRDMLPGDMARFRQIQGAFLSEASAWGYQEVRTPTLEHLYLFTSSGTLSPQLLGRTYSFLDWDGWTGERVVLRPDATIPVSRLYREQLGGGTAKLAYVANIFRFNSGEEPREVWQCGAELIGDTWPGGDVELIALAAGSLRTAGVSGLDLRLSHPGILRSLLERAGFSPEEQLELYDRLLDGQSSVMDELEGRLPELGPALRLMAGGDGGAGGYLDNLAGAFLPHVPGMATAIEELRQLVGCAELLDLPVRVTLAGARDFEYYTGPVFELLAGGSLLAGGGRYDRLITDAEGREVPACGFAMHIEAIMPLLEVTSVETSPIVQFDTHGGSGAELREATRLAGQLRSLGARISLARGDQPGWTIQVRDGQTRLVHAQSNRVHTVAGAGEIISLIQARQGSD